MSKTNHKSSPMRSKFWAHRISATPDSTFWRSRRSDTSSGVTTVCATCLSLLLSASLCSSFSVAASDVGGGFDGFVVGVAFSELVLTSWSRVFDIFAWDSIVSPKRRIWKCWSRTWSKNNNGTLIEYLDEQAEVKKTWQWPSTVPRIYSREQ